LSLLSSRCNFVISFPENHFQSESFEGFRDGR
jgi:hypothetical protein